MDEISGKWTAFAASPYFWDVIALACGFVSVIGFLWMLLLVLGLPGRIAFARNHPDAEAVYAMGWVGFVAVVPWIQALIWAFRPTSKIDIRYLPQAERLSEQEAMERMAANAYGKKAPERNAAIDAAIDRESGTGIVAPARSAPAPTPPDPEPRQAPARPDETAARNTGSNDREGA